MQQTSIEEMDEVYQRLINKIHSTPATNNYIMDCAYLLACAIKECMTHKDNPFGVSKGYIWEKVSKAMRAIDMPIQEEIS